MEYNFTSSIITTWENLAIVGIIIIGIFAIAAILIVSQTARDIAQEFLDGGVKILDNLFK